MRKTSGSGAEPRLRLTDQAARSLQFLNMDSVAGRQTPPDSVQFAVAILFVAQVLAPLRRRVLACKHGRGFQIRPGFDQVVEDLDPVLRIPADCEIVNEEDLNPGIPWQNLRQSSRQGCPLPRPRF